MKVLIADKLARSGLDLLATQAGFEVIEAYSLELEQKLALAADIDAVIVRSETRIDATFMAAAPKLKAIGRAGVGVDNIDVETATSRGIVVMNTPTGNTIATAELTFAHILCSARKLAQACASLRAGQWDRKSFTGRELHRKVLGIIGMGRIGGEVARRAMAFGMRVLAFDPYLAPSRAKAMQVEVVTLEALYSESDYITLHMPLTDTTYHLVNDSAIRQMKDGVMLFNCARGGLIDEEALLRHLESGKVAAVGLDVFEKEPLPGDHPLRRYNNVTISPHLGASTEEAQESVGLEIAQSIVEVLAGGLIRNAVNMPSIDAKTLAVLGPYLELGTRLGTLAQQLSPTHVESLQIVYSGKVIDLDTNSLTRGILKGFLLHISGDDTNFVNAPVILQRLGIAVDVTKSNLESDYTELIEVEVRTADGSRISVAGTLIGKQQLPRIVSINGREVEAPANGTLLVLENDDIPGMVGIFGSIIGRYGVNIAALFLGRQEAGTTALTVINLDSSLGHEGLAELREESSIRWLRQIRLS